MNESKEAQVPLSRIWLGWSVMIRSIHNHQNCECALKSPVKKKLQKDFQLEFLNVIFRNLTRRHEIRESYI